MVSPQRGTAGAAGNGAAVSPVTRTGASGTGRNESQSGPRRRPRGRGPVSGFRFQVGPPEAPAQLEEDAENEGLPTTIGLLTRSRQVGSKRAARGSTPRHRGLTLAGFRGGGVRVRCWWGGGGVPALRWFFLGRGRGQRGDVHGRSRAPRRGAVRGRYTGVLLGIVPRCNGCAASQCGALLGHTMGLCRARGAALG